MSSTILFSNAPLPVEVTFDDPGLFVGVAVYKLIGINWIQSGPIMPASYVANNTYMGIVTPTDAHPMLVLMQVYTDNTYTTLADGYFPSSRSFVKDTSLSDAIAALTALVNGLGILVGAATNPQSDINVEIGPSNLEVEISDEETI